MVFQTTPAKERLEAKHLGFGQTAPVVATLLLPGFKAPYGWMKFGIMVRGDTTDLRRTATCPRLQCGAWNQGRGPMF